LICQFSNGYFSFRYFMVQCVGSRTDSKPTVDQSDMRGLVTA
jgi:nitrate reductase cytochrome c-type subunit